jgi:hypothetical protein
VNFKKMVNLNFGLKYQRIRYFMACSREYFFCLKRETKKFNADGRFLLTDQLFKNVLDQLQMELNSESDQIICFW